ncbi:Zn-ribbon domain-containing OB-fold protein [[Mycobacterium] vasticus]|uniref:OB-fold domain-containing protein n=1 Tax=[Mycobacterium] vasticus TaxID=2875777 RepID=A0ABU5YZW5_9MYCO|nr:OB-fold domain-containing protein [Mycolicibacter sp. MYC017]MEB3070682.1 OB-fold domain-containing protein [Mycolicibacter sp. MYC017]
MTEAKAPLPALDPANTPFWTGGADGNLLICKCDACHRWLHPPVPICRFCLSTDVAPESSSGRGEVLTYTINRQPWLPTLPPPYVIAVIGLDDDPELRLTSRLVDVEPDEVAIGMRVRVCFEEAGDVWLPLFTPERSRS